MKYRLKIRSSRPTPVTISNFEVISTYTLDHQYVQTYTLADDDTRKVQPAGSVLAFDPASGKVLPNFTSYGFAAEGVLLTDADCGDPGDPHDVVADVLWRGLVLETRCWDNGVYGTVLSATKNTLADRIMFVKRENRGARSYRYGGSRNR